MGLIQRLIERWNPPQAAKTKEPDQIIKLRERYRSLIRRDIDKWRKAHGAAINPERPRRTELYDLYHDVVLDTHLSAVMQARILNILNTPFYLVNESGEKDDEATKLIEKKWALRFNELALESRFWGYSLIELVLADKELKDVKLFPREHVVPEFGAVLPDLGADEMVSYMEPPTSNYYIGVGDPKDLGLLLKAAPLQIFKKNAVGHWGKLQELYGIPPRFAKTMSRENMVQDEIMNMLLNLGSAGYALFPEGTEVEMLELKGGDVFNIFDKAIDRANTEMSKLILGQTMTTDNGSSRSQSEVHERKEEALVSSDLTFLEYEWNDKLLPLLAQHGYAVTGLYFQFDRSKKMAAKEQWLVVKDMINMGFIVPEDYLRDTFYVPIEGREKPQPAPGTTPDPNEEEEETVEEPGNRTVITLKDEINRIYSKCH